MIYYSSVSKGKGHLCEVQEDQAQASVGPLRRIYIIPPAVSWDSTCEMLHRETFLRDSVLGLLLGVDLIGILNLAQK